MLHIFVLNKYVKITPYHEQINKACEELCILNPQLLLDKGERWKQVRVKVHNESYKYKKGCSRLHQYTDVVPCQPKRIKFYKDERDKSIMDTAEQM